MPNDVGYVIIILAVLLLSLGIHEFAHAKLADMAGDPTPRIHGRVTLNILKHLDVAGTLMIIFSSLAGFGFGWAKPVPMDSRKMRNPRWDFFWAVAAGPLSNLLQAAAYALGLRLLIIFSVGHVPEWILQLLFIGVLVNCTLFLFNLLPIGPLDGHHLVATFLPERARFSWYVFNRTVGSFILLFLVISGMTSGGGGLISRTLQPLSERLFQFLVGRPLI